MNISNYERISLKNKTALITGASSGIGKAISYFLGHEGVRLFLVSRRLEKLQKIKNDLQGKCEVICLNIDINSPETISEIDKVGGLNCDILINNAGLAKGKELVGELNDIDTEIVLNTNLISAIKLTNQVYARMSKNNIGDIVHVCSIASHDAYPGGSVYCASKFGLWAFTQSLRKESFGKNIRVMNISPGMVETEFSLVRFNDPDKAKSIYANMKPLTSEDIAFQAVNALKNPRHVNIDEIVVLATDQAGATQVHRE